MLGRCRFHERCGGHLQGGLLPGCAMRLKFPQHGFVWGAQRHRPHVFGMRRFSSKAGTRDGRNELWIRGLQRGDYCRALNIGHLCYAPSSSNSVIDDLAPEVVGLARLKFYADSLLSRGAAYNVCLPAATFSEKNLFILKSAT